MIGIFLDAACFRIGDTYAAWIHTSAQGSVLQRGRNNFLMSSAVTKDEERKRTGLSQSFLDTWRSFSLSCEKLPDNGPPVNGATGVILTGIKGVSHTYERRPVRVCMCARTHRLLQSITYPSLAAGFTSGEFQRKDQISTSSFSRRNDYAARGSFALCYREAPTFVHFNRS